MNNTVIDIRDLWFSYNGQPVLTNVNFKVARGEFMAIIGPNGGGKTTLLKLMLGLLEPDRGKIRIFGLSPRQAVNRIGYVPQNVHINRDFPISVLDVVLMGRLGMGSRSKRHSSAHRAAARQALERLEMWSFHHRHIGELSGGQLQKVFIARALVTEPEILFLDEPTASVDTKGQGDLYTLLQELNQTITILLVSHDVMALSRHIKSVACVNRNVLFHDAAELTEEMVDMAYPCPVDIIAHGLPHRVLPTHEDE
jgi:zinc transport system ATP-binding protein